MKHYRLKLEGDDEYPVCRNMFDDKLTTTHVL